MRGVSKEKECVWRGDNDRDTDTDTDMDMDMKERMHMSHEHNARKHHSTKNYLYVTSNVLNECEAQECCIII